MLGTNKFARDINIMNPSYIQRVFTPIRQYCVQDGMNFKLVPYKAQLAQPILFDKRDNRYVMQQFTEETYDFFLNGYKDKNGEMHPLQWGNLNADIYVAPVSINMGTVQRQTFSLAAQELLEKGDTARARQMVEISEKYFPEKNFCYDKYSIMLIDLYNSVYGKEKATQVWDSIFKYYSQNMTYYTQYIGTSKAAGVNELLQETAQLLYGLNQMAEGVLQDKDRANQCLELLQRQGYQF
jgi:hypothetical protein